MRIEELTAGQSITLFVKIGEEQLSFDSKIQEVYPKKRLVLADPIYFDEKVITFKGKHLIVDLLVPSSEIKPQLFKNISVTLLKKPDGALCYNLSTIAESKPYNRRKSFRCFVGLPSSVQCGPNRAAYDVIIKDISYEGFSVVCPQEAEFTVNQVIHVLLNDYIEETAENYSFHLYGIVVRIVEMENNRILYGCKLNNKVAGLDAYIMKKERIRLRKSNGGNL